MDFLKDLNLDKVRNLAEDAINQAKPKTDLEAKVYEVLSHKNWGASSTLMNEIARDTFDYEKFAVISQLTWEAMENQRPAAWRVVFKGLTLLEHLIKNGSERCVDDARNHGHSLRALHQFNYYEGTIDRGLGVREKSKQLVEILADDDRIREERQKARQLREKFGGNLGGAGSQGGGHSSGGSSNKYAGYGNDNWNASSSSTNAGGAVAATGYSGRYGNDASSGDSAAAAAAHSTPTPTFAAMPDDSPKKSKGRKKKKKDEEAYAPEPVVDLFSFDDPAPTLAPVASLATAQDDDFGDFASAGGTATPSTAVTSDPFAVQTPAAVGAQFDAFGGGMMQQPSHQPSHQQQSFNAFGGPQSNSMFPSNNTVMGGGIHQNQHQLQQPSSVMSGAGMNGFQQQHQQQQNFGANDDDFGDFAVAAPSTSVPSKPSSSSTNPMSKLISLDGLSKNMANKQDDKLNQPIIANAAAATFVQEKDQIQQSLKTAAKGNAMSFQGIDGLQRGMASMSATMGGVGSMMPAAASMGINPSVMGNSGASASTIGMLDPSFMGNYTQQQHQQQHPPQQQFPQQGSGGGMMYPQMMGGSGMGMMNPNMQVMMNQGTNPQMMGGMYAGAGMGGANNNMGGMQQQQFVGMQTAMNNQQIQQQDGMGFPSNGMQFNQQQQGGFQ